MNEIAASETIYLNGKQKPQEKLWNDMYASILSDFKAFCQIFSSVKPTNHWLLNLPDIIQIHIYLDDFSEWTIQDTNACSVVKECVYCFAVDNY